MNNFTNLYKSIQEAFESSNEKAVEMRSDDLHMIHSFLGAMKYGYENGGGYSYNIIKSADPKLIEDLIPRVDVLLNVLLDGVERWVRGSSSNGIAYITDSDINLLIRTIKTAKDDISVSWKDILDTLYRAQNKYL